MVSAESRRNSAKNEWNRLARNRAYLGSTAPGESVKDWDPLLHFFTRVDPAFTLRLRLEANLQFQVRFARKAARVCLKPWDVESS